MRLSVAVFILLAAFELGLLAFVDTSTLPIERTARPVQIHDIATGTAFAQRFEVRASGLSVVWLKGEIMPGAGPAELHARILEAGAEGTALKVVRTAAVHVANGETGCCVFRFEPIPDSRWRSYRIDLGVGELNGRQLSLWLAPGPVNDLLTINRRSPRGSLVFRTQAAQGTGLQRVLAASVPKRFAMALLALIYNSAIAAAVFALANACRLRRA